MKKNNIFLVILTFCFVLLLFNDVLANSIDNFLPEELKKIKLDMSIDEYNKNFPDAKPVVKNLNCILYSLDIKKDILWNTVACIFDEETLSFFSLTIIETGENLLNNHLLNIDTEACNLINKISKSFGKLKKKYIIEKGESDIYYEPLMIWESDSFDIQISYTPRRILEKTKNPFISLTFHKKGIDYSRFYPKIIEDNDKVSFDSLLSDEVKKVLYNSIKK